MSDSNFSQEINTSFAKTRGAIKKKLYYLKPEKNEDHKLPTIIENDKEQEICTVEDAAASAVAIATSNDDVDIQKQSLEKEFIPYKNVNNIVYEYYNDYNKLCERLQLLLSSKIAGNSNHDQEINTIIDELRSNEIIV